MKNETLLCASCRLILSENECVEMEKELSVKKNKTPKNKK